MATLMTQFNYFFGKSIFDLINGSIPTSFLEKMFDVFERKFVAEHPFALFHLSHESNDQLIRLIRLILEPALLLTWVNANATIVYGYEGDYSAGIFLTLVIIAHMNSYKNTMMAFANYFNQYLSNTIDDYEYDS